MLPLRCTLPGSLLLAALQLSAASQASECARIALHYHERPPFLASTPQGVRGLVADPAARAFQGSGIPFSWVKTPAKRQLHLIMDVPGCDCLAGWFKLPERERHALFSAALYRDRPTVALARADNPRLHSGMAVDEVLSNRDLVAELKEGYSYGTFLDARLKLHATRIDWTTAENTSMLLKLHQRRADYLLLAPEEADALIAASGLPAGDFKQVRFRDMPPGETRHIMCNPQVGQALMHRLDAAIAPPPPTRSRPAR